jgi:hypothetical protein
MAKRKRKKRPFPSSKGLEPGPTNFRRWFKYAKTSPNSTLPQWRRDRGGRFERALYHLLAEDKLRPRTGYRLAGEQIDGSFLFRGRLFLLEAKWQKLPVSAKELLAFHGKLEGKLAGTLGVFLSMSGYAENAADALTKGKSLMVIMFGTGDLEACFNSHIGFVRVLEEKLRVAAEEGLAYWPYTSTRVTRGSISEKKLGTE